MGLNLTEISEGIESSDRAVRGNSIRSLKEHIAEHFFRNDYVGVARFFITASESTSISEKICSILKEEFDRLIAIDESSPHYNIELALSFERILENPVFSIPDQKRNLFQGKTYEYLSRRANEISAVSYLRKAIIAFNRAGDTVNAERLTNLKDRKAYEMAGILRPMDEPPEEVLAPIRSFGEQRRNLLLEMPFEEILQTLCVDDVFQLLFDRDELSESGKGCLSLLETIPTVVVQVHTSGDGRVLNINDSDIELRALHRGFELWKISTSILLTNFGEIIYELLNRSGEDKEQRASYLAKILSYSSTASENDCLLCFRLVVNYMHARHLEFISIACPYLEKSIRNLSQKSGYNINRLDTDPNTPEMFKVLTYLSNERVQDALSKKLAFTLQAVLLIDEKGFGLNVRNDVAHGLLDYRQYTQFLSSLMMYLIFQLAGKGISMASSSQ